MDTQQPDERDASAARPRPDLDATRPIPPQATRSGAPAEHDATRPLPPRAAHAGLPAPADRDAAHRPAPMQQPTQRLGELQRPGLPPLPRSGEPGSSMNRPSQGAPSQGAPTVAFGDRRPDFGRPPAPAPLPGPTPAYGVPFGMPTPSRPPQGQETAPAASGRRGRARRGRAAVAVLSVLLPLGILGGGVAGYVLAHQIRSFDERKVEFEVAEVLRDDFGMSDLGSVNCPAWIKVEQGQTFQCEFDYAGATQTVTVTQGAQSGQLVVGSPKK